MGLFDDLLKVAGNEYASKVVDGMESDVDSFIDTGSYSLNALLSGSIYGGIPANKVTALAGETSTGKTFFALNVVKQFLKDNPDGAVFYFETESALTTELLKSREIDTNRFYMIPVSTIQEFRTQAVRILDKYLEADKDDRKPMFMVLDSLGMLSTEKEVTDIADGVDKRDMTRAQLIRGAFRVLTLKLGRAKVTMLITNHTYNVVGSYVPTTEMGGGSGLKYSASTIIFLSKKKEKDGTDVTGNIITATLQKSRLSVENKKAQTLLDYHHGLDKYYGLLDIAEKYDIIKKVSTRYEMPDGTKVFGKHIAEEPEKYYTPEILALIDEACKKEYLYGKFDDVVDVNED
jgi:RecA/RadA recombinase